LGVHLLIVIGTLVAAFVDTGYWRQEALRAMGAEFVVSLVAFFAVIPGMLLLYVSPVVLLVLFIRAFTHDRRYGIAAFAEGLLAASHAFVALPLVQ